MGANSESRPFPRVSPYNMGRVQNLPEVIVDLNRLVREKTRLSVSSISTSSCSNNPSSISNILGPDEHLTPVKWQHCIDRGLYFHCGQARHVRATRAEHSRRFLS